MLSPILSVSDIDASVVYYTAKLGFSHQWSIPGDDGKTGFACVSLGSAEILLGVIDFVAPEDRDRRGIGIQLYIELPAEADIDALYVQAKNNSATITRDIEDRDWGVRAFNVKDLDGFELMLAKPLRKAAD